MEENFKRYYRNEIYWVSVIIVGGKIETRRELISMHVDDPEKISKFKDNEFGWVQKMWLSGNREINANVICSPSLNKYKKDIIKKIEEVDGCVLLCSTKDDKSFKNIKEFVEKNKKIFDKITCYLIVIDDSK